MEVIETMTKPDVNGTPTLPKRSAAKGLLPSTWQERTLKVEYTDCHGSGCETSGVYLDHCATGVILNIRGAKTLIAWDRLAVVELQEDR